MSDPQPMIYGATGYTGRLLARAATERGLRPVLAGRSRERLAELAGPLGLEFRVADLDDADALDRALRDVGVVVHAAGPFRATARPMVDACLRARVHYLDLTGEVEVFEALRARDAAARERGIMLMPGAGYDVVATDCAAAHVARRLPGARCLRIGLTGLAPASRGSARTLIEAVGLGTRVRREGRIVAVPVGSLQRAFDFGDGPRSCFAVSWGDVASAWYTTGIPDIEVHYEATPPVRAMVLAGRSFGWALRLAPWQVYMKALTDLLPDGPSEAERARWRCVVVAEASDAGGRVARCRLRSPEGYGMTAAITPRIVARVLEGDLEVGFQTPARVYGPDFVLSFPDVQREDLAA